MSAKVTNFAKAIDPAVKTVFNGAYKAGKQAYKDICAVKKADDCTTEMASNVGLSMARGRTEQDVIHYEDLLAGNNKNLTQYEYSLGTKISRRLMKWNKLGQIKSLVSKDAQALVRRREFDATQLIERGDATSYTHSVDGTTWIDLTGGDAVALASASHSTVRSSTAQSNVIGDGTTSNMDLAEDSLEAAETVTAPAITDDSDQVILYNLDTLFCSRKKSWTAMRLLKTAAGRVGTPNNDINLVKGRYNLVVLDYMSSARSEYYALKDTEMNNGEGFMSMLIGTEIETDGPYIDFDTKAIKYSYLMEHAMGHNEWRSYLHSQGDNT